MILANLIDLNLHHAESYDDALEKGRFSNKIRYVKNLSEYEGITIFTDLCLGYVNQIKCDKKVAWIMEPRAYCPDVYRNVENLENNFDLILTYDEKLLKSLPNKSRHIPADGIFLDSDSIFSNHEKNKMCSHIYSNKTILSGHKLRHTVADLIRDKQFDIDLYGSGSKNKLDKKSDALKNYRFSIAIENHYDSFYITEKIYDCFAMKTVPVYYGSKYILEKFDKDGILMFQTLEELEEIIKLFTPDLYLSMIKSIETNYQLVMKHYSVDDHVSDALKDFFNL
jgi:hypothetical protein